MAVVVVALDEGAFEAVVARPMVVRLVEVGSRKHRSQGRQCQSRFRRQAVEVTARTIVEARPQVATTAATVVDVTAVAVPEGETAAMAAES